MLPNAVHLLGCELVGFHDSFAQALTLLTGGGALQTDSATLNTKIAASSTQRRHSADELLLVAVRVSLLLAANLNPDVVTVRFLMLASLGTLVQMVHLVQEEVL